MIVTIRTGPHSLAQGKIVERTGSIATIRVGDALITGELIERKER